MILNLDRYAPGAYFWALLHANRSAVWASTTCRLQSSARSRLRRLTVGWLRPPQWNQARKRLVPEPVIREMAAALADPVCGPSHQRELAPLLRDELARLDPPPAQVAEHLPGALHCRSRHLRRLHGECHGDKAPHVLEPGSPTDTHPYPVELDLPPWTVERDIDLRNWLFGFGAGIRIESPEALRDEHRQKLQSALEAYQPA